MEIGFRLTLLPFLAFFIRQRSVLEEKCRKKCQKCLSFTSIFRLFPPLAIPSQKTDEAYFAYEFPTIISDTIIFFSMFAPPHHFLPLLKCRPVNKLCVYARTTPLEQVTFMGSERNLYPKRLWEAEKRLRNLFVKWQFFIFPFYISICLQTFNFQTQAKFRNVESSELKCLYLFQAVFVVVTVLPFSFFAKNDHSFLLCKK